jgi:hypothetical protein
MKRPGRQDAGAKRPDTVGGKFLRTKPRLCWRNCYPLPLSSSHSSFEANPRIERIVFICTPHFGSTLASGPLGRLGSRIILPAQVLPAAKSARHARGLVLIALNRFLFGERQAVVHQPIAGPQRPPRSCADLVRSAAYREALGADARDADVNSCRWMKKPPIAKRIAELQAKTADKCRLSREAYTRSLVEMYEAKPCYAAMDNPRCDVLITRGQKHAVFPQKLEVGAQLSKLGLAGIAPPSCGWKPEAS